MSNSLVLLPGMNCTDRLWGPVAGHLANWRPEWVLTHGSLEGESIEDCVARLLHLLPDRFALAGLSLGGIVAMAIARIAPDRVSRLCLMSTNARAPSPAQLTGWEQERAALADGQSAAEVQERLLPVLLHGPNRTQALDDLVVSMGASTGSQMLGRQLKLQATRIDEREALRRVRVPSLVIASRNDALCPLERHTEIHRLIDGSDLEVLENVGHLSTLEAPRQVATAMSRWLD